VAPELRFSETGPGRSSGAAPLPDPEPAAAPPTPLSPAYSFDTFVVGPCNELAHAACLAVAEHPGRLYNPLVIFGAAGLGKTHLLNATGNRLAGRRPGGRLVYCSCEAFTNELIQAVRFDGVAAFREKYRQVDGLLLDDLQFLAGRERTQEEFFHTFNALYEAGKQIILTSDQMPRDIPGLEKRLQTRFEWGLLTDLQPPDEETKVAILQKKAAEQGVDLSRQVCSHLAGQPESNVRVLEGYLTRVIAVSRFQEVEITLDLVERVVRPLVGERRVELEQVLSAVAGHYGLKVGDLKGSKKTREITRPRQVAMYLARRLTSCSFPQIGRALGNKDHSTVVKGVKRLSEEMSADPDLAARVRSLERLLREGQSQPRGS
jgi:chromosomal replication initiator protein